MVHSLIGLLDCNNFYVSCERLFRPDLQNRPVVVLSNNDGCVIARSNEVKKMGVPMGAPYFQIRELLASHNTAVFSSNFSLYGDISSRVMSVVESLSPRVEVYSIDEVFIDFTGVSSPLELGNHIRSQVLKQVGIPTCIGISSTKTLSKVANRIAKKDDSYNGVCLLLDDQEIDQKLHNIHPVDIWGIGRKSAEKLSTFSITTALQLKNTDPKWMRRHFTITGERIIHELNGLSCLQLDDIMEPRKSMQVTRTFAYGITDYLLLREKIASFAARLGEKLRQHQLAAPTVSVFVRTNQHKHTISHYQNCSSSSLPFPANDDFTLIDICTRLFNGLYRPGFSFHKAGVSVYDLVSTQENKPVQLSLFKQQETINPKTANLMKSMDALNNKFGRGTIHVASCGFVKRQRKGDKPRKNALQGHQLRKSPAYTTRWSELPFVK